MVDPDPEPDPDQENLTRIREKGPDPDPQHCSWVKETLFKLIVKGVCYEMFDPLCFIIRKYFYLLVRGPDGFES